MNNFTTRLGHPVGRLIQSLFPQDPEFKGRRVVTFHNQRDFIFFRHHWYIFETREVKKTDSKDKTDKDGVSVTGPERKAIARLQVRVSSF
ncbi:putative anticodon-binding, Brix domain-containing protein [Lupinus albus]|uniref:Putative anticodon-binding, Brix domain-containing protein n=1 Tax=Lupinus albus TaxID=3870 RepID=A0A6A4QNU1_LUPAL|nr:putative anticodon-binding, Brix domain-containing protein [Lupinus albus]